MEEQKIVFWNGKYEIIITKDSHMYAKRYGEMWRDLTGDNLILALIDRIAALEGEE